MARFRQGMASFWFWSALFTTSLLLVAQPRLGVGSGDTYWDFNCSSGNFTPGDSYETFLKSALSILPEKVSSSAPLFFANDTIGSQTKDQLYAVASCRGDSSNATICKSCVTDALQEAPIVCPFKRGATILYEGCTVAYSDKVFKTFSMNNTSSDDIALLKYNKSRAAIESDVLRKGAASLIDAVIDKAAELLSPAHFATGRKVLDTDGHKVYAVAECIPALSSDNCHHCLRLLNSEQIYSETVGGRISNIWCEFRWEMYIFFAGAPLVDLPGDAGKGAKHHHNKHIWVIAVAAAAGVIIVVAAAIVSLLCWRKKLLSKQSQRSSGERKKGVYETSEAVLSSKVEGLPSALDSFQEILKLAASKEIVLFLDYDGTLSPIVSDPDKAYMPGQMRRVLEEVARCFKTSIVSGRAREKVYQFVGLDGINYAGSHGLDIKLSTATATTSAGSSSSQIADQRGSYQPAEEHLAAITEVYNSMLRATSTINGATVENNKYCVSVHYRNVAMEDQVIVREVVDEVLKNKGGDLHLTQGKMVLEIRPPTRWKKGDAVLYLLEHLGLGDITNVLPIYIGDDTTDEDAFKVLRDCGVGILVSEANRETSAVYSLQNPSQVMHFLAMLVKEKQQELASRC